MVRLCIIARTAAEKPRCLSTDLVAAVQTWHKKSRTGALDDEAGAIDPASHKERCFAVAPVNSRGQEDGASLEARRSGVRASTGEGVTAADASDSRKNGAARRPSADADRLRRPSTAVIRPLRPTHV
jgi:hypothetical protein